MVHLLIDIEKRKQTDRITIIKAREEMLTTLCRVANEWIEVEHYSRITINYLKELAPKSVILSGNSTPWEHYDKSELKRFMNSIREWKDPLLGICGGHQLLAMAYGGIVGTIRRALPGEPTDKPNGFYYGYFIERGMREVQVVKRDSLFDGLPDTLIVDEGHFCEVKKLPEEFVIIASNNVSRVQAMRHKSYPIYGVQFHPHKFNDQYPHGRKILEIFFKIADRYSKSRSFSYYFYSL